MASNALYDIKINNDTSLDVINLSYDMGRHFLKDMFDMCHLKVPAPVRQMVPGFKAFVEGVSLERVSFHAPSGKVTAIISSDQDERRTLTDIIGERRYFGAFDGNIVVNNSINKSKRGGNNRYSENVAFVPRKSLYMPGLTYYEMVYYAARLRVENEVWLVGSMSGADANTAIENRVLLVLEIMDLSKMRNRLIGERPVLRGELGGDLRRLSIAMDIVALPPVIVLDEPMNDIDPGVSLHIMTCLKKLAARGHVVVCSLGAPNQQLFAEVDRVVLLSEGRTIYAGDAKSMHSFFCSKQVGYHYNKADGTWVDFLLDIASGAEQSTGQKDGYTPLELQNISEKSSYYNKPIFGDTGTCATANDIEVTGTFGLSGCFSFGDIAKHTLTLLSRAVHVKFHEFEIIKKSIGVSVLLSLLIGNLDRNNGDLGYYCLSLVKLPYANATNVAACLFFSCSVMFIQQILNVHINCQKLQMFRYEQRCRTCPTVAFYLATMLAELPFTSFYAMVYSNICYFLVKLNYGYSNYWYFMKVMLVTSLIAFQTAMLFSSLFHREFVVRDFYLMTVFVMLLFSGFPFQFSGLANNFEAIAQINPMRWAFEGLMVWKFSGYEDGEGMLTPYDFQNFDKDDTFPILGHFVIFGAICFFLSLLPPLKFLKRKSDGSSSNAGKVYRHRSGGSADLEDGSSRAFSRKNTNNSNPPVTFSRESSFAQQKGGGSLSISVSETGDHKQQKGPTVNCNNLTYRIKDIASPAGERIILHDITGQFDWGKLSMILGGTGSGKSSLLHVLAGDLGYIGNCSGDVLFNGAQAAEVLPWQRCAFVEALDEHFRDLTVLQTVTYAMKLRCLNRNGLAVVEENVTRTLDILELTEVKDVKVKKLSKGDVRRLSIAEEIVHGPALLLVDEPTTGLDLKDCSTMCRTFREMVNQDKTVIATLYQPSSLVLNCFDTCMLLSHGRVIYHGPVSDAVPFFVESPFGFIANTYVNPSDFLVDVATNAIPDVEGNIIGAPELSNYYMRVNQFAHHNSTDVINPLTKQEHALHSGLVGREISDGELRSDLSLDFQDMEGGVEMKNSSFAGPAATKVTNTPDYAWFYIKIFVQIIGTWFSSIVTNDWDSYFWKMYILTERSTLGLWQRPKLVMVSVVLYILMGTILGFLLGDTNRNTSTNYIVIQGETHITHGTTYEYNTTAFFAIGLLLCIFANVGIIFYWVKVNEVFYKEHSRGLYSNIQQWLTSSNALYILRIVNAWMFCAICYDMLVLRNDVHIEWFYYYSMILAVLAGTMLCETMAVCATTLRNGYILIPAIIFLNFAFSGIFVKGPTLPDWAAWVPTFSLFRWTVEAEVINLFNGDPGLKCVPLLYFCTYDAFVGLFGWDGATKWYCFWAIVVNLIVCRGLILIAYIYRTFAQKGVRQFRKPDETAEIY